MEEFLLPLLSFFEDPTTWHQYRGAEDGGAVGI